MLLVLSMGGAGVPRVRFGVLFFVFFAETMYADTVWASGDVVWCYGDKVRGYDDTLCVCMLIRYGDMDVVQLFCVFDGHGGKHASSLLKTKVP